MKKMMIVKQFKFEAAHFLPEYNGKCKNIHGHSYLLEIGVEGYINNKTGMVMDFSRLKEIVSREIIDILDHTFLNTLQGNTLQVINFPWVMPTAENIVDWILWRLEYICGNAGWKEGEIALVRLWETSTSYVEWRK